MIARWWGLESRNIDDVVVTAVSLLLLLSLSFCSNHQRRFCGATSSFSLDTLLFVLQPDEWLALFYSLPSAFSARRSSLVIVWVTDLGCQRLRHFVKRASWGSSSSSYETRVARGIIPHHVAPCASLDPRRSSSRKCRRELHGLLSPFPVSVRLRHARYMVARNHRFRS